MQFQRLGNTRCAEARRQRLQALTQRRRASRAGAIAWGRGTEGTAGAPRAPARGAAGRADAPAGHTAGADAAPAAWDRPAYLAGTASRAGLARSWSTRSADRSLSA